MKKIVSIIFINLILFMSVFSISPIPVYAAPDAGDAVVDGIFSNTFGTNQTKQQSINEGIGEARGAAKSIIQIILIIFYVVGIGLAIIIITIIGTKLVLGSIEQKAEAKKHLVPYVIGLVVVVAAAALLKIVQNFVAINI